MQHGQSNRLFVIMHHNINFRFFDEIQINLWNHTKVFLEITIHHQICISLLCLVCVPASFTSLAISLAILLYLDGLTDAEYTFALHVNNHAIQCDKITAIVIAIRLVFNQLQIEIE
jgi:hypothetical protein